MSKHRSRRRVLGYWLAWAGRQWVLAWSIVRWFDGGWPVRKATLLWIQSLCWHGAETWAYAQRQEDRT